MLIEEGSLSTLGSTIPWRGDSGLYKNGEDEVSPNVLVLVHCSLLLYCRGNVRVASGSCLLDYPMIMGYPLEREPNKPFILQVQVLS